jgi:hypothetical protein
MPHDRRQEVSSRREAVSMLVASTAVLVIVVGAAYLVNKGTPQPKFFVVAGIVYAVILAVSVRGMARGGRWLYQIADGRVRVERPGEAEPVLDLPVEGVVGIHKRYGRKTQSYYLVDPSGEEHKVPEHGKMHVGLLRTLRERIPDLAETRESKRR